MRHAGRNISSEVLCLLPLRAQGFPFQAKPFALHWRNPTRGEEISPTRTRQRLHIIFIKKNLCPKAFGLLREPLWAMEFISQRTSETHQANSGSEIAVSSL